MPIDTEDKAAADNQRPHQTDDLHQAAYLWCCGLEPALTSLGANRVQFTFVDSRTLPLVGQYVRGEGRVEPLRFSAAVRELKRRARECVS